MKGKVYKIINNKDDKVYIGSCFTSLQTRFRKHKSNNCLMKRVIDENKDYDFNIILIKEYFVVDRNHLFAYEQLWMNKYKSLLYNKFNAVEYLRKEKHKQYLQKHKEYFANLCNQYYQEHKEEINKKNKNLYTCDCGKRLRVSDKPRHERTKQHLKWVETGEVYQHKRETYYCKACDKILDLQHKSRHMKTKKHKSRI